MKFEMTKKIKNGICYAIAVLAIYVSIACGAYALRNPTMTDTQRLLHLSDAVLWR